MDIVEIEYIRPPDHVTIFRQQLVHRSDACIVTCLEHAELRRPVRVRDAVVLEPGAAVVWFTFPGAWHDIGRFHTLDDRFTGYYANVLTPVELVTPVHWRTTDLFLDVWLDGQGPLLLDEEELSTAEAAGAVAARLGARARREAERLLRAGERGAWPPPICAEYTLERCRAVLQEGGTRGRDPV